MASGLLLLLDDIATVLDDIAILTKVAAKKTAGVLGDDLALNAQQVAGVDSDRELVVVWSVAKGSLVNKSILVPVALLLSAFANWAIQPLLIIGGLFLCFEGCEKLAHKFLHKEEATKHQRALRAAVEDPYVDLAAVEKDKISGAIRTDFILSAEIIVISLEIVSKKNLMTQASVLTAIAILMTGGVYGLVAGIVKLDDLGTKLLRSSDSDPDKSPTLKQRLGKWILASAPILMKTLSVLGTAAMFLVGGGIFVHNVHPLHEAVKHWTEPLRDIAGIGPFLSATSGMLLEAIMGIIGGMIILLIVTLFQRLRQKSPPIPGPPVSDV